MIPYSNCDKLNILTLIIIIKILQQSYYNENFNKKPIKNPPNINLKNKVNLNNLSFKKNTKNIMNAECIFPIQEENIEDDTQCIKDKSNINTNTPGKHIYEIPENINTNHNKNILSTVPIIISKINIDIPIKSTFKLKNATLDIENMKNHIYLTTSKVLPMY
ncbi:MAG: hypothetical protein ACREV6_10455 [Clostridium sp.]|uniref:hypothetical protein n=1 Tax=Clostridium sp. TaxID=1506 RepID=UPI003D6D0021